MHQNDGLSFDLASAIKMQLGLNRDLSDEEKENIKKGWLYTSVTRASSKVTINIPKMNTPTFLFNPPIVQEDVLSEEMKSKKEYRSIDAPFEPSIES